MVIIMAEPTSDSDSQLKHFCTLISRCTAQRIPHPLLSSIVQPLWAGHLPLPRLGCCAVRELKCNSSSEKRRVEIEGVLVANKLHSSRRFPCLSSSSALRDCAIEYCTALRTNSQLIANPAKAELRGGDSCADGPL